MLVDLINSCGRAYLDLDARVAEFDAWGGCCSSTRHDGWNALTQPVVDISVRIPESEQTLTALRGESRRTWSHPIASNVEMAKSQLAFAN